MTSPVTDPDLIARLDAQAGNPSLAAAFRAPVDPALAAKLDAVTSAPAPARRPILSELARQFGLTGRYALEGAGNTAGIVSDPAAALIGYASGTPLNRFPSWYVPTGKLAAAFADKMGLPKPQGGLEEGVGAAARAMTGAGLTMGAGLAAGAPALAAQPGLQLTSAATGAASSDAARQAGGGTGAQLLAGLLGGLAPAAPQAATAGIKAALTGGEQGRQAIADNVKAFADAGTTPSVGQATQSRAARAIEGLLDKAPGGGPISAKAQTQAQEIGAQTNALADSLAPSSSPATAGRAIDSGITGAGGFMDRFRATAKDLYDKVDQYIPKDSPVSLSATKTALAKMVNPIQGAENTSGVLSNPKLQEIADAVRADTHGQPGFGALPYDAVKQLRSRVGELIADNSLVSDAPRAQLKRLYGALSEDIKTTASQNPRALQAANRADAYYKAGMERIDKLDSVVNKVGGPESIFQAAMAGTKEGATTLNAVMRSLQPDEANVITSAVIRRMGRANPSAQNDVGDVFSTERFLTNWNSLSPQAKSALFSRGGRDFQQSMDSIAKVASNLREGSAVYRNPSGTGKVVNAAQTAAAAALALLTGNPGTAAAVAGGVGTANLASRLMTSPTFVRWFGRQTKLPAGALQAQVNVLANQGKKNDDADVAEFVPILRDAQKPQ